MKTVIQTERLYTPEFRKNMNILIEDKKIMDINPDINNIEEKIDLRAYTVLPGLIDMHVHGAVNNDTMDASYEAINEIATYKAAQGVTSFLPTTLTAPLEKIKNAVTNVADVISRGTDGARVLGSYLEGPYISAEYKGAHPKSFIRKINLEEIKDIIFCSKGTVRIVALAPEKAGSSYIIDYLKKEGIKISLAHTNATYQEAVRTIEKGADIAVHIYNGMRGFHHREAGMLGAVLNNDQIKAELIVDKNHVSIPAIQILLRCRGVESICLITDSMRAAGLDDGNYTLGELNVEVKNGVARIANGSLAGSTLKLIDAVKNMIVDLEVDYSSVLKMATINPARVLGVDNVLGSIEKSKKADIIAIDNDYNVVFTMIDGQVIYENMNN